MPRIKGDQIGIIIGVGLRRAQGLLAVAPTLRKRFAPFLEFHGGSRRCNSEGGSHFGERYSRPDHRIG